MNLLTRLNADEGITIVVVTHESGVANQTNKIVHIKDGCIERIEENLDHNASPFGVNGFMKYDWCSTGQPLIANSEFISYKFSIKKYEL